MNNSDIINAPMVQISFGTCQQTNEAILNVYVKTIKDAISAARGNYKALKALRDLFAEAKYVTDDLMEEAYNKETQGATI